MFLNNDTEAYWEDDFDYEAAAAELEARMLAEYNARHMVEEIIDWDEDFDEEID